MRILKTKLLGVLIVEPKIFEDDRGFFKETFQTNRYLQNNIGRNFVQDNFSRSKKNVLRGLHYQISKPQGKLVSCTRGSVYDVVVDIDVNSPTFREYVGIELSEDNHRQVWISPGYAHGFCVISNIADFQYKCTDYYDPSDEGGIIWNDPDIAIDWPIINPIVSKKDGALPKLKRLHDKK